MPVEPTIIFFTEVEPQYATTTKLLKPTATHKWKRIFR